MLSISSGISFTSLEIILVNVPHFLAEAQKTDSYISCLKVQRDEEISATRAMEKRDDSYTQHAS